MLLCQLLEVLTSSCQEPRHAAPPVAPLPKYTRSLDEQPGLLAQLDTAYSLRCGNFWLAGSMSLLKTSSHWSIRYYPRLSMLPAPQQQRIVLGHIRLAPINVIWSACLLLSLPRKLSARPHSLEHMQGVGSNSNDGLGGEY